MQKITFQIAIKMLAAINNGFTACPTHVFGLYEQDIPKIIEAIGLSEKEKATCDLAELSGQFESNLAELAENFNNLVESLYKVKDKPYSDNDFAEAYTLMRILLHFESNQSANFIFWPPVDQKMRNFLQIFADGQSAIRFIAEFYKFTGTYKKFEAMLEWHPVTYTPQALRIVHELSTHTDIICHAEYRNKFRHILNLLPTIADFVEKIHSDFPQSIKIIMSAAMQQYKDKPLAPKKYRGTYGRLIQQWTMRLKMLQEKRLSSQELIDLYLDIATCLISAENALSTDKARLLIDIGADLQQIQMFVNMQPNNSDQMLPNLVVAQDGYFLCKLSYDDARGPFLGLVTGCCQHLGDAGRTSAQYGYTQSNSCFYVMFKGQPSALPIDTKQLSTHNIVAQTWAWRLPGSNTIVFNSIEMAGTNSSAQSLKRQHKARLLFYKLAKSLVDSSTDTVSQIKRVMVGASSGPFHTGVQKVGVPLEFVKWVTQVSAPEHVHTDRSPQELLYDREFILEGAIKASCKHIIEAESELPEPSSNNVVLTI